MSAATIAVFHVERRVHELRAGRAEILAHEQGDARVPLEAVPAAPVVWQPGERLRHLRGRGLDLLQADDFRRLALDPFAHLLAAGADAVHIPGGDSHERPRSLQEAGEKTMRRLPTPNSRRI